MNIVWCVCPLIFAVALLAAPAGAEIAPGLTAEDLAEGWISLFDGKTLYGWKPAAKCNWRVADGAIVVDEGEIGLLRTTSQFADYLLRVDFRAELGTNSGIFLRTPPQPKDPGHDCYELNIAPPANPFPTASFVKRSKVEKADTSGQWQTFEIRCEGGQFAVKLDGRTVLEYQDPQPLGRGFIGLQHNAGKVEFRNIHLKPLNVEPIFNGRDLSNWNMYPRMESQFMVTEDGLINVKNGPGQLETRRQFGDFVMQLECISHGRQLNSGIFFRCIPGDRMMGYESQIHNGYIDGDRTRPVDCGTGGIFRRKHARRVVSDDFEWFFKTLVVEGPHVAVWVNGHQVCDWTDQRNPNENPRRGLRLDRGTIMIQGHDPTTDLSFRNLRASELPPRWATNH